MRNAWLIGAVLCLFGGLLFASGGGESPAAAKGSAEEITWLNFIDLAGNDSWSTTAVPQMLQKQGFNVRFRVVELGTHDGVEYINKVRTMVAAGETPPDIIHLNGLQPAAIDAGWYAKLDLDTVRRLMPQYYQAAMGIYDKLLAYGKDPATGTLYGLVSWNMFGATRHTFVYRKDWLDRLGLGVPRTITEFETFLKRVRTTDFNGNGQFDEYGYTSGLPAPYAGFQEVFGAYGVMPMMWMNHNDVIQRGEVMPGAREALATLARWYAEDLIPKGVGTTETRRDGFNQGIRGTFGQADGYAPALVPGGQMYEEFRKAQPNGVMLPAPSFKGPRGEWGTQEWGPRKYTISFGSHLEKNPAKLEMLLKMLETLATTEELFAAGMLGERGKVWDFVDPAKGSGATRFLEPYTEFNKRLDEIGVREMSESPYVPVWVPEVYTKYLDPLAVEYGKHNPGYYDALMFISFPEQTKYGLDLESLTKESFLSIIAGAKPLGEFEAFAQTWKKNGGEEMTRAAQTFYDKVFK
jgi:putative aldouronate transport system substrate-binding protein